MNILLVRPDGIGDEILCLPVASAIRRLLPDARMTFLSSAYTAPILDHHPDLDAVVTVSGQEPFGELVAIFRNGFDAAIFLKPFRRLMLAAFVARVPDRVATGYRWYSFLANRRVYEHRRDFSKHESEYNVGLLRGLGLEPGPADRPVLILTQAERDWARMRLSGLPGPRVILHPGGRSPRLWRSRHYWELAKGLTQEGIGVLLAGAVGEVLEGGADIPQPGQLEGGVLNLVGTLTVRELMAVIGASNALVSGSTGPAHIAAAVGVPTVSIFDPRRMSVPVRWGPLGEGVVLKPDVPTCEKCIYEACPYWDCLDRISVEDVMARVRQVMTRPASMSVVHV